MSKNDLSELYDYIDLGFETTLIIAKHLKDGAQFSDIIKIIGEMFGDAGYREKVSTAIEGSSKISDEIKSMGVDDSITLVMTILPYVAKLIAEIKDAD